jgi:flagellar export protein FliJ
MRDIHTLIKMQKLYVDEQRKVLAAKQREADSIVAALAAIATELENEKKTEAANKEGGFILGAFIRRELDRKEELEGKLVLVNKEVDVEREKLAVLFEELKRYELIQENWDEEEQKRLDHQEKLVYDEQAGTRHHEREKN